MSGLMLIDGPLAESFAVFFILCAVVQEQFISSLSLFLVGEQL
jgi:hypothetical protein